MLAGGAIFAWWTEQLRSLLPWRHDLPPDALIVELETPHAPQHLAGNLLARRHGREEFIARLQKSGDFSAHRPARAPVCLRLPGEMQLSRELILPAIAERHLAPALRFEMDRFTPFEAQEVLWSVEDLRHERRNLRLTLRLVPRRVLEPLLAALRQIGLAPVFLETGRGRIALTPPSRHPDPVRGLLTGLCGGLSLAIALLPAAAQQKRIDQLDRRLQNLLPAQLALDHLRQQLQSLDIAQAIDAAGRRDGDALRTLAALTDALPAGSWAENLTLTPDRITLAGQSDDAARLIPALLAAGFSDPAFIGPITRSGDRGETRFSIAASPIR